MSEAESSAAQAPVVALGVRHLAEFVHRTGDIHVRYERATSASEGREAQRSAQRDLPDSYLTEVSVTHEFDIGEQRYRLAGRIDGCDPEAALIEEYKATRAPVAAVHRHSGDVHLAQLRLYGALLAKAYPEIEQWQLTLCYCHPDTLQIERVSQSAPVAELAAFLDAE